MYTRVRHFSTFLISPRVPPSSGVFFRADERGIVYLPKKYRFDPPKVNEILKLLLGTKNKVFIFLSIWGHLDAP